MPSSELTNCLGEDPVSNFYNLAGFFGQRNKPIWRNVAECRMVPSNKRLCRFMREIVEANAGLINNVKLVACQRDTQVSAKFYFFSSSGVKRIFKKTTLLRAEDFAAYIAGAAHFIKSVWFIPLLG